MRRRLALTVLILLLISGLLIDRWLFADLPSLDRLTENLVVPSTKILARDGRLLYQITDPAGVNHTTVALDQMPLVCRQAIVATEDASFYTNPGIDVVGIVRALWINLQGGETLAGGSTITQQVARNVLLDPQARAERTLTRKLRESILAARLTRAYSKDDILALYLNQTYFGHLSHGVETAAQTYFGTGVRDLDLAQCALLAGLPQAPALYDPLIDPQAAQDRQAVVLGLMVKAGYITDAKAQQAANQTLTFSTNPFPVDAPHFAFGVWQQLEQTYSPEVLYSGLTVTTTLDRDLTRLAEDTIALQLGRLADDDTLHNATNAALVALDPRSGQLLAYVGSADYFSAEISGAVDMAMAPRQPGSALKPLTYALAFDPARCGTVRTDATPCPWTPATMILDVRTGFVTREGLSYVPQNYDLAYHGPVLARVALAGSLNVPAVLALDEVGVDALLRLAGQLGLDTLTGPDRYGLALTLGGGEVRLVDLVGAYGVFAYGGQRVPVTSILKIEDAAGNVIYEWMPPTSQRVLDERVAYLITDILSDNAARVATYGEFSRLNIGRPAAVKTGTTTDFRDNWTVGYTPDLVVGVWVGNADYSPMLNLSGVDGAAPIWHSFMRAALRGKPESDFVMPGGLARAEVCALSGLLPTPDCPRRVNELFIDGTQPVVEDTLYQRFVIDRFTGELATEATPPERRVEQVFIVWPPEAEAWARERGLALPPTVASVVADETSGSAGDSPPLSIARPDTGTIYQISPRIPLDAQRIPLVVVSRTPLQSLGLWLDGVLLHTFDAPPWETLWQLAPGQHVLIARGVAQDGSELESAPVTFVVLPPE